MKDNIDQTVKCKKSSFKDKESANKHIIWLQANSTRESIPRRAYLCDKCSTWHLTSKPNKYTVKPEKIDKPESDPTEPNLEIVVKELTLELIQKKEEIEAMTKQLNKMYKEIYELNDTIKTLTKNGKKNN